MPMVDQVIFGEAPEGAIPLLVKGARAVLAKERRSADSLRARPPELQRQPRLVVPVEGIEEAALLLVPSQLDGLPEARIEYIFSIFERVRTP